MTLSAEAKSKGYHSKDYNELSQLSKEGLFVNIVSKAGVDRVAERFFSSMDIYPSNEAIFIREYFGTFWSLSECQSSTHLGKLPQQHFKSIKPIQDQFLKPKPESPTVFPLIYLSLKLALMTFFQFL